MSEDFTEEGSLTHPNSDTGIAHDLSLLLRIVESAHKNTELGIEEAIHGASETHFADEAVGSPTRRKVLDWLLLKVAPGAPPSDLHGHFERIFEKETGIKLEFEQGPRGVEDHLSEQSEADLADPSNIPLPLEDESHEPSLLAENIAASTMPYTPAVVIDDQFRGEHYLANPPIHFQDIWNRAERRDLETLQRQSIDLLSMELMSRARSESITAMQRRADYVYERRLAYKVVSQWRNVVSEHWDLINAADSHYKNVLGKKSHAKLFDIARIQRIHAMDEVRLKGSCLYKMSLALRERQMRSHIDQRLQRNALWRLINQARATQAHQRQLETILEQQQAGLERRAIQPAVHTWVHKVEAIRRNETAADQRYEQPLRNDLVDCWRHKVHKIEEGKVIADDLREFFLKNRYICKAMEAARAKRNRREVLGRWTLSRWRHFAELSKHQKYDRAYKVARRGHKQRIARIALQRLYEEHIRIGKLDVVADEHLKNRNRHAANTAVVAWYNKAMNAKQLETIADARTCDLLLKHAFAKLKGKTDQARMMETVADQYDRLHTKQAAEKVLSQMSLRVFDIQRKEQTADAFNTRYTTRQNRQLMRRRFDQLRVAAADRRGEGPLRLPPATPAQQRAADMIRLTSTTPLYTPARRSVFTARLRANPVMNGRMTQKIVEEVEHDDENGNEPDA